MSQPRFNREIKTWEPCETCTEVIQDTLNGFKDNAVFTDDDIPSEIEQFPLLSTILLNVSEENT